VLRRVLRLSCWRYCFLKQGNQADYLIMDDKLLAISSSSSSFLKTSSPAHTFFIKVSRSLDTSIVHSRFSIPAILHTLYPVKVIGIFLVLRGLPSCHVRSYSSLKVGIFAVAHGIRHRFPVLRHSPTLYSAYLGHSELLLWPKCPRCLTAEDLMNTKLTLGNIYYTIRVYS
jgi:hypothetical protein